MENTRDEDGVLGNRCQERTHWQIDIIEEVRRIRFRIGVCALIMALPFLAVGAVLGLAVFGWVMV